MNGNFKYAMLSDKQNSTYFSRNQKKKINSIVFLNRIIPKEF